MGRIDNINGVIEIANKVFEDERGNTVKNYDAESSMYSISQNLIIKNYMGTLRGIHFQTNKGQKKIITCLCGTIYVVLADFRVDSDTFGEWISLELNGKSDKSILVPPGVGIGTYSLTDSILDYKCEGKYYPESDNGILWDDPWLNIDWPVETKKNRLIISQKDLSWNTFMEFQRRDER